MSVLARLVAALLVALALSGCGVGMALRNALDGEHVVRGTLNYRDPVALPPDSTIVVTLLDTTPVIKFTPIVAETVLRGDGKRTPIPFELPYDRARIAFEHNYGVRAAIRSGDKILFETAGASPVITRGNPMRVDLELVRVAAQAPAAAHPLVGSAWRLEDLGGAGVIDRAEATLEFPELGRVAGQATCNRFSGHFETSGPALTIARLAATKKLCAPAMMDQETKYLRALEGALRFDIEGTTLLVYAKGIDRPLRFVKQ